MLPAEVVSEGLHQAGERGAIREFDIGAAVLPAPGIGRRPRTSSLDGGCMLGGQFPREEKDEAHAPTRSAVVRGGRRKDQEQRVASREGDSAIVSLIQWPDGPMN